MPRSARSVLSISEEFDVGMLDYLAVSDLSKSFETVQGRVEALTNISLRLPRQSFTAIIGSSGCGKSTLLRIMAGLEHPDSGTVCLGERSPDALRREGALGMVFQDPALLPWRNVVDNIILPLQVLGRNIRAHNDLVNHLVALVGLDGFEKARPAQLSGGMRQRVAIARALVTSPSLLLLDEPFAALDLILRRSMNQELQRVWMQSRPTTVLVTHGIDEAVFLADRVVVMSPRPGRVTDIVEIDLPRPRGPGLFETAGFRALSNQLEVSLTDARA